MPVTAAPLRRTGPSIAPRAVKTTGGFVLGRALTLWTPQDHQDSLKPMELGFKGWDGYLSCCILMVSGCMDPITCQDTLTCHLPGETSDTSPDAGTMVDSGTKEPASTFGATDLSGGSSTDISALVSVDATSAIAMDASTTTSDVGEVSTGLRSDGGSIGPTPTRETDASSGETTSPSTESLESDEATTEAPEVRCDPSKPFGRTFVINAISLDDHREYAMVAPDGLTAYVRYDDEQTIYASTRSALFEEFGTPQVYSAFDDLLQQEPSLQLSSITADGLTVYLSPSEIGSGPIRSAHRATNTEPFQQLIVHEELSVTIPLAEPWVSPDGERLYAYVPAYYMLFAAQRTEFGFSSPARVSDTGSIPSGIYTSVLTASETVVYSVVNRVTEEEDVQGLSAIGRGTRASKDTLFDSWELMAALDGPGWDQPIWVSDDECEIIIRQDREDSDGSPTDTSDIFIARRGL